MAGSGYTAAHPQPMSSTVPSRSSATNRTSFVSPLLRQRGHECQIIMRLGQSDGHTRSFGGDAIRLNRIDG